MIPTLAAEAGPEEAEGRMADSLMGGLVNALVVTELTVSGLGEEGMDGVALLLGRCDK
ncbi:MAG: hypothetical protein ACK486_09520 [Cyanobacteriota bacterium]|jgi:hypothetical protein